MLPFKLVYHDEYNLELGEHVFPGYKYREIRKRLLESGLATTEDFVEPNPATEDELLLVHTRDWISRLLAGRLSLQEILTLELPFTPQLVRGFLRATGGTILAARLALRDTFCINLGGGFHHAFPDHGEGFCAINDIAVAIRVLQREGLIRKALVVDCDVHHGNGTAAIFAGDRSVFTLSIHQYNNYPAEKPPSDIDIHLPDGTTDAEYLQMLQSRYELAISGFRPDLAIYVAGADPYYLDQLGGLSLTLEGLEARDRLVFETAARYRVPVAVTLAGGYAIRNEDTVTIHVNTVRVAREVALEAGFGCARRPAPST